ncbi:hypothetical protein ACH5RR_039073 [Cinchona calisaya]|uniref:Reverse transcriptase zinc-binding domain-containing protein n=1 Tax=Cinchona calisaya TaxID=153742 RepID=A0ABD2Y194_9GENT
MNDCRTFVICVEEWDMEVGNVMMKKPMLGKLNQQGHNIDHVLKRKVLGMTGVTADEKVEEGTGDSIMKTDNKSISHKEMSNLGKTNQRSYSDYEQYVSFGYGNKCISTKRIGWGLGSRDYDGLWDWLWKLGILEKVKVFLWKVCHNVIPTARALAGRGVSISTLCQKCNVEVEDLNHVLFDGPIAKRVWELTGLKGLIDEFRQMGE